MGDGSQAETWKHSVPSWIGHIRAALRVALIPLGLGFLLSLSIEPAVLAAEANGEYLLKSAFLYNFAKFVEWPTSIFSTSSTPLTICVLGNDPFGSSLEAIAEKTIKGRALVVKRLRSVGGAKDCQMLYVSPNELTQTAEIVRTLQKAPILTVCDVESCAQEGIMVNMRMVENRVQLDMNLDAVQRTPLKVSSQLIKLTRIVKGTQ
ncbi:MAG: YfiR family protein [Nitrospirota bacterium]